MIEFQAEKGTVKLELPVEVLDRIVVAALRDTYEGLLLQELELNNKRRKKNLKDNEQEDLLMIVKTVDGIGAALEYFVTREEHAEWKKNMRKIIRSSLEKNA